MKTDILPQTTEFKTQFFKEEYFDMKYSSSYNKSHPKIISDGGIAHSYIKNIATYSVSTIFTFLSMIFTVSLD